MQTEFVKENTIESSEAQSNVRIMDFWKGGCGIDRCLLWLYSFGLQWTFSSCIASKNFVYVTHKTLSHI